MSSGVIGIPRSTGRDRSLPFRVLVVSQLYPRRSASGAGTFVHRSNRGLARQGFDVHVLQLADWTPPWPASSFTREWQRNEALRRDMLDELDGIPIHHPATIHPRPSRFFDADVWKRQVRALTRYVKGNAELAQAHAVIGHFLVPDGYHAVRLAQELDVPSLALAWGDDIHAWPEAKPDWRHRLQTVLRECDQLVACSQRLAIDGALWSDRPTDWEVIYAGTDLERFRPASDEERVDARSHPALRSVPRGAPIVLMIAQPVIAKGYLEIFEAWEQLSGVDDRWQLVMVGANWGNVDVAAEISSRGLTDRARWLGQQPAEAIPVLLRASNAFVLPSHNEGLSLSLLEAMATGLPVVATDVGGHSEVLRHCENGWLIPAKDVGSLVRALSHLMTDERARASYGHSARSSVQSMGSPDDSAARLATLLERLISQGPRRRRSEA